MSEKAICIHGHYYQPAREDPLTGEVGSEVGAHPYRNWNERIHDQCYRPNAELGNFEKISFDLGPTLINWMVSFDPATFAKIVEQERRNFERFGVGNGMAQPYHHTILPLAKRHDKITQIHWGIVDFEYRFGHKPSGVWLPEAAVDYETLQILVDEGIEFTILAPWQAEDVHIDVGQPYWVELGGGRRITVFFYEAELSMRVSFDPVATSNGDRFMTDFVLPRLSANGHHPHQPKLYIIASDGELYGHHQPFRDKFLYYLTHREFNYPQMVQFTYPGLWLRKYPPNRVVKIREQTSWSCHHGVARWKEACPCAPHGDWKTNLRQALDWIADQIDEEYVKVVSTFTEDYWGLLYRYIEVLLGKISARELIRREISEKLDESNLQRIDLLLRAQLFKQRMFTSCGWFFEDFDRIEPRIVVVSAAQAVWWLRQATGVDLIQPAQERLAKVRSWRSNLHGDQVFKNHIERLSYEQLSFPFVQSEVD